MRLVDTEKNRNDFMQIVYDELSSETTNERANRIISAYDDLPTVEDAPIVFGEWKYYHNKNKAVCTNCSFERDLDLDFGKAVSCPNCGATMTFLTKNLL